MEVSEANTLRLRVAEADSGDMHRGAARLSTAAMAYLGVTAGEVIQVTGLKATVTRAFPTEGSL
ncbi:MAG TPA: hypothetical protein VNT75_09175, partial [Symbiobacteriaceae bacterium]|nr:hypothetical protein [Symbiobacteriaceae bacterium]